uniref:Acyl-CoA dehydrogenase/oxidase N-terminal domain-containing protein n=1 Tax=Setaria viridis TaxID=4556 RepID=A0A4U6VC11_SETVI|nr:hypothetical protein SEVIR_4G123700v2 [Setaria viridis]
MKPSELKPQALDMSVACPRLTPAPSAFPAAVSDYYQLDELLTPEENDLRIKIRLFMENDVAPIIPQYWETAVLPFHLIPKLGSLGFLGGIIKGHECPGLSATAYAMCISEVARVDASIASFCLVQSCLAMLCIAQLGSESQKDKYLPSLSKLHKVCAYALTEPDYGSDASSLNTVARKVPGGWVLNGRKRWPGNSSFADVLVVLARNTSTNQVNGFIVNGGSPGLQISKIENKVSMRMVQNCDIELKNVFVPEDDRLPVACFQSCHGCLGQHWHRSRGVRRMPEVPGREETVARTPSRVPAEPREACQDAWQHPGHVALRLAPLQAARLRQDDHRPGQPGQGMDHEAGKGDGGARQGALWRQRHCH